MNPKPQTVNACLKRGSLDHLRNKKRPLKKRKTVNANPRHHGLLRADSLAEPARQPPPGAGDGRLCRTLRATPPKMDGLEP